MASGKPAEKPKAPEIVLQFFEGCPNVELADQRVREAAELAGLAEVKVQRRKVSTPQEAEQVGFAGSPTILIDQTDPFEQKGPTGGFSCRVYQTPDGPQGAPSITQLAEALKPASGSAGY